MPMELETADYLICHKAMIERIVGFPHKGVAVLQPYPSCVFGAVGIVLMNPCLVPAEKLGGKYQYACEFALRKGYLG